ncbi:MAG: cyclic-di-AMP receptor, partial [Oscillospiraceae bacterium]|nr:cyclic-di-AMP receptor [Oscillospiraceae bacterium]
MKLIIAIISNDDSYDVLSELTKAGFDATKLSTTGGFLSAGNVTLL